MEPTEHTEEVPNTVWVRLEKLYL